MPKRSRRSFKSKTIRRSNNSFMSLVKGIVWSLVGLGIVVGSIGIGLAYFLSRTAQMGNYLVMDQRSEQVLLVHIDHHGESLGVIIDGKLQIPLVNGYQTYKIGVVDDLGFQEKKGFQLLEESMLHWSGVEIHGTFLLPPENSVTDLISKPRLVLQSKSDVGLLNKLRVISQLKTVSFQTVTDLLAQGYLEPTRLADGSVEYVISDEFVDSQITTRFQNLELVDQGIQVAVINTTRTPGLAQDATRTLRRMGFDVVSIASEPQDLVENAILVDSSIIDELDIQYLEMLSSAFKAPIQSQENVLTTYRAHVAILATSEYDQFLHQN